MKRLLITIVGSAVLSLLGAIPLNADSWFPPEVHFYYSENGEFSFVVIPAGVHLDPKLDNSECKFEHPKNLSASDNHAAGVLYQLDSDSVFRPVWISELVNPKSPTDAMVHNSGRWVVTFNDWHYAGVTDNAVVIYDQTGELVANLALADFLWEPKIAGFRRSVSSLWWYCDARFVTDSPQIEITTYSNDPLFMSAASLCEDYTRLDLNSGELISFESAYDEALVSFPDPCYDDYHCPFARFYAYRALNPDPKSAALFDSLGLEGSALDSLASLYRAFREEPLWRLSYALRQLDRYALPTLSMPVQQNHCLLVELKGELYDADLLDSIPVVIMLPDSTLTFPLSAGSNNLREAVIKGADCILRPRRLAPVSEQGILGFCFPSVLSSFTICTPDSARTYYTNVSINSPPSGFTLYINLAADQRCSE